MRLLGNIYCDIFKYIMFINHDILLVTAILLCKAELQFLVTCKVSRYFFSAFHGTPLLHGVKLNPKSMCSDVQCQITEIAAVLGIV